MLDTVCRPQQRRIEYVLDNMAVEQGRDSPSPRYVAYRALISYETAPGGDPAFEPYECGEIGEGEIGAVRLIYRHMADVGGAGRASFDIDTMPVGAIRRRVFSGLSDAQIKAEPATDAGNPDECAEWPEFRRAPTNPTLGRCNDSDSDADGDGSEHDDDDPLRYARPLESWSGVEWLGDPDEGAAAAAPEVPSQQPRTQQPHDDGDSDGDGDDKSDVTMIDYSSTEIEDDDDDGVQGPAAPPLAGD